MAVNRVDFGGNTLIDLTGDTLESAEQLMKGIIAHARDGSVITGQMEAGGGGGSVEPFTKIISGTITFAEETVAFQLPETENFLAAYFIRTDFWGVKKEILDSGAQAVLFASGQSFGYFSPQYMSSSLFQNRDALQKNTTKPILSGGNLTFDSMYPSLYGSYYYALLYGAK